MKMHSACERVTGSSLFLGLPRVTVLATLCWWLLLPATLVSNNLGHGAAEGILLAHAYDRNDNNRAPNDIDEGDLPPLGMVIAVVVILVSAVFLIKQFAHPRDKNAKSRQATSYPSPKMRPRRGSLLHNLFSSPTKALRKRPSFQRIPDMYKTLGQVSEGIRESGLESCNLIIGVDFTKSNDFQGKRTFGGRSLHHIDLSRESENPYQTVIRVIGKTLSSFDEDNLIPAFGFGDIVTQGHSVFPFIKDRPCHTFQEVLTRYNQLTPMTSLSGPTNFAPLIHKAIEIVQRTKSFHLLVIVADGQVTSPRSTVEAIVEASKYPLGIVMIGVGDGPWDMMEDFDDNLPDRCFDNFQFVDFAQAHRGTNPDASFALHALMELPSQFRAIRELEYL